MGKQSVESSKISSSDGSPGQEKGPLVLCTGQTVAGVRNHAEERLDKLGNIQKRVPPSTLVGSRSRNLKRQVRTSPGKPADSHPGCCEVAHLPAAHGVEICKWVGTGRFKEGVAEVNRVSISKSETNTEFTYTLGLVLHA